MHGLVALERLGYIRSTGDAADGFDFGLQTVLAGLRASRAHRATAAGIR